MIRNLLSNAVKYTEAGKILLGCRRRGDKLRIEVWDTGIGIPEEQLHGDLRGVPSARQSGARAQQAASASVSPSCERLADLLGHAVDVRSRPGKGSVFAVEVPLGREDAPASPRHETGRCKRRATSVERGAILVVEDDPRARDAGAPARGEGHRTTTAADGREALELVGAQGDTARTSSSPTTICRRV